MRDELRQIADIRSSRKLETGDFGSAIDLARKSVQLREEELSRGFEEAKRVSPDIADDVYDDLLYYNWVDCQHIWQMCLVHLQGVLEGIICSVILNDGRRYFGLRAKLDALRGAGIDVNKGDYDELLLWGELRNAFTHNPLNRWHPGPLRR